MYGTSDKELREIIQDEGSFMINKILARDVISGMDKKKKLHDPKALAAKLRTNQ
jgi:jasmonate O-methyltransferase